MFKPGTYMSPVKKKYKRTKTQTFTLSNLKTLSPEEVQAGRSPAGGFTKKQLAAWGVPWPPPKGWKRKLEGKPPKPFYRAQDEQNKKKPSECPRCAVDGLTRTQIDSVSYEKSCSSCGFVYRIRNGRLRETLRLEGEPEEQFQLRIAI